MSTLTQGGQSSPLIFYRQAGERVGRLIFEKATVPLSVGCAVAHSGSYWILKRRSQVKAAELRTAAAWDFLQLGPAAKDAVPSLIAALKDDDFFVRLNAAAAFGQIGPQAAPAIPALIPALTNQYRGVRFNSAYSLELLGPLAKDAIPALKVTLRDSDPEVRAKAKEALEKIEPSTSQSAP